MATLLATQFFFAGIVLYNQLIQCFVLIEIETYKPNRQNIGQLQMFVNYYERIKKNDNATIEILLCAYKNVGVV